MLETSKDLLNIVIAFCVLWFTVFICWLIYYLVTIIRRVAETTEQVAKMSGAVSEFFGEAKERLKKATSYVPLVIEGAKNLVDYLKERNSSPKKKNSKKT